MSNDALIACYCAGYIFIAIFVMSIMYNVIINSATDPDIEDTAITFGFIYAAFWPVLIPIHIVWKIGAKIADWVK